MLLPQDGMHRLQKVFSALWGAEGDRTVDRNFFFPTFSGTVSVKTKNALS